MAFKAYRNNILFFDTNSDDPGLTLTKANLNLEVGAAGSFICTIPPGNPEYGNFHRMVDTVEVWDGDGNLLFTGRVYSVKMVFNTQYEIECEGMMAVLNDSIYRPHNFTGSLRDLFVNIIATHNAGVIPTKRFDVGEFTIPDYPIEKKYSNYETSLARLRELVNAYGGFLRVRKLAGTLYLDWLAESKDYLGQKIVLGQNLLDLTKARNSSQVITFLIPTGATQEDGSKLTIADAHSGTDYITADPSIINEVGMIWGTKDFPDINDPTELMIRARAWLDEYSNTPYAVTLKVVDLIYTGENAEPFKEGYYVQIVSEPHGMTDTMTTESSTVDLGKVDRCIVDVGGTAFWLLINKLNLNLLDVGQSTLQVGGEIGNYISVQQRHGAAMDGKIEVLSAAIYSRGN